MFHRVTVGYDGDLLSLYLSLGTLAWRWVT